MTQPGEMEVQRECVTLCNRDCPDTCAIRATVERGRVVRLRGDPSHPVTRGFLCYRTNQFLTRQYSDARLTSPLLRKGDAFVPVTWDEALSVTATRLTKIREESGGAAIFHYRSGGSLGLLKTLTDYFFALFGPVTVKQGDICSGAGEAAQSMDFGECDSSDLHTLLDSRHILLWGKNVHASSPHTLMVLRDAKARGASVVLIDPVHHEGAKFADAYHQLAPGGDFALAMAVAHLLFVRGAIDPEAARYCDFLDEFEGLATSQSVADWCREADVPVAAAEDLARRLADKPCAIVVGWGMGRRSNGGAIVRALDALCAISGNLGIAGGGVSFYYRRRNGLEGALPQVPPPPRTICEPLFGEQVLAAREPPIRALWVTAGNPGAMLPDSERVARAIRSTEFSVVVDSEFTDTARLATLVLPTTTLLEEDDLVGAYGHHFLGVSRPVVEPPTGVRSDLQIVQDLAERVGLGDSLRGSAREWKRRFLAHRLEGSGVGLEQLERGPVRNPLAKRVLFSERRFATATGRVQLIHDRPPPPAQPESPDPEQFPLQLLALSTRQAQSSQWAGAPPDVLTATINPTVAPGVSDGQRCRLRSAIGCIDVVVRLDARQRSDVVIVPKGGHFHLGASGNALVQAKLTDIGQGGALYEERVRLEV